MISIDDINVLWLLIQRTPMDRREARACANILGSLQRLTGARLEAGEYTGMAVPVIALPRVGSVRWAKKYKQAVAWIASNDDGEITDLVAELFEVAEEKVTVDVSTYRKKG
jgi:hypothetical protein